MDSSRWPHEEVSNSYVSQPPRLEPRQRKRLGPGAIVLIVGLCLAVLCFGAFSVIGVLVTPAPEPEPWRVEAATNPASGGPQASVSAGMPKMVVEVTGTGPALISWNISGMGSQDTNAQLPWKREFGPFQGIQVVSVVAQTKNTTTSASITINMSLGDKVFGPCQAQGPGAVASCSGGNL